MMHSAPALMAQSTNLLSSGSATINSHFINGVINLTDGVDDRQKISNIFSNLGICLDF
jgi:hypothetical protein